MHSLTKLSLTIALLSVTLAACDDERQWRLWDTALISDTTDGHGPFVVSTRVDGPVTSGDLQLFYTLDKGMNWDVVTMRAEGEARYVGAIDPLDATQVNFYDQRPWPAGTTVQFYVSLTHQGGTETDPAGAPFDSPPYSFVIGSDPRRAQLTELAPRQGSALGNQVVFMTGGGFESTMQVRFGTVDALAVEVVSSDFARLTTPPHPAGTVALELELSDGTVTRLESAFTFEGSAVCIGDQQCPAGYVCNAGVCKPKPLCVYDEDCPSDLVCEFGQCQPPACGSDADCLEGYHCLGGRCAPPLPCQSDLECAQFQMICVEGACQFPNGCRSDSECEPGDICVYGICQPRPNECIRDTDCRPGLICEFGQCVNPPVCLVDSDCDPSEVCQFGQCIYVGCSGVTPCPPNMICDLASDLCVPRDPCDIIGCPPWLSCDPLTLRCVECFSSTECGTGRVCVNGLCTGECSSVTPCQPGYMCIDGYCEQIDPCQNITCPPNWVCEPDVGGCVPLDLCGGIACPPGYKCDPSAGMCVLVDICQALNCPPGTRCDPQMQTCLPVGLCDGVACPPGTWCDANSGQCIPQPLCTSSIQCDDGRFCNGIERCLSGRCEAGGAVSCPAPAPCWVSFCSEAAGGCDRQQFPDGTPCPGGTCLNGTCNLPQCVRDADCNDSNRCNGVERCLAGTCAPGLPLTCNDNNVCSLDTCFPDVGCFSEFLPDGTSCGGGNVCLGGVCNFGCTNDSQCSDGRACNGREICLGGACAPGPQPSCNDIDPCTQDICAEPNGSCLHPAAPDNTPCGPGLVCLAGVCSGPPRCTNNADCSDGSACNGQEFCVSGQCVPGIPQFCEDTNPCTGEVCNEPFGTCTFPTLPNGTPCDAAGRVCLAGICGAPPTCTTQQDCNDGLACNGTEFCVNGTCLPAPPVVCNDNNPCTQSQCAEPFGVCTNPPVPDGTLCDSDGRVCKAGVCGSPLCTTNSDCDDGLQCNGAERCVGGACIPGPSMLCVDGNRCTSDQCVEPFGLCLNPPVANGTICDTNGGTCENGVCNGTPGCRSDTDCTDGIVCNGNERCVGGLCTTGPAIGCGDANACTLDSCIEPFGVCDHRSLPNGTICGVGGATCQGGVCQGPPQCQSNIDCSDGLACNGFESCIGGTCVPGLSLFCRDNNPCTRDRCAEPSGLCAFDPEPDGVPCGPMGEVCMAGLCKAVPTCNTSADCSDGVTCNGSERCVGGLCILGTAVRCDDGNPCTSESCVEPLGTCDRRQLPNGTICSSTGQVCFNGLCSMGGCSSDMECSDGQSCNGVERCEPASRTCLLGTPVDCSMVVGDCRIGQCVENGSPTGSCSGMALPDGIPCQDNGSCRSGVCTHSPGGCRADADCVPPRVCDPFQSQCVTVASCTTDAQCGPGQLCIGGQCTTISQCNSSADCPSGTVCYNGTCYLAPTCYSDLDCAPGEQCDGWACQPVTCLVNADCQENWMCRASRCIPPAYCTTAADCPLNGLQCINWVCQNPGGCQMDAGCPPNQSCLWGGCYFLPPPDCSFDVDCLVNEFCYLGYCQPR